MGYRIASPLSRFSKTYQRYQTTLKRVRPRITKYRRISNSLNRFTNYLKLNTKNSTKRNKKMFIPIKNYEDYSISKTGIIKNRDGRVIFQRDVNGEKYLNLCKHGKSKTFRLSKLIEVNFEEVTFNFIRDQEYATYPKENFYSLFNPPKPPNYSKLEVIFELEIKGKKIK
jgi:hypothetical protein